MIYNVVCVINTIALFYIKDANKYGVKVSRQFSK